MTLNKSPDSAYVQETRDLLEGLEALLLDLETNPDPEAVDAVFRTLHTIKGGGGMFGYRTLSGFLHHFEDAFDKVREGKFAVTAGLIDLALRARDHVNAMLECGSDGPAATEFANSPSSTALLEDLQILVNAAEPIAVAGNLPASRLWKIRFRPEVSALRNGMRPDLLIAELAAMGTAQVFIDTGEVPGLDGLDPLCSYLSWTVLLDTTATRSAIEGVFVFADDAEIEVTALEAAAAGPDLHATDSVAQLLSATKADAGRDAVPPATSIEPAPVVLVKAPTDAPDRREGPQDRRKSPTEAGSESVRVSSAKLDDILDQLGELVIAQSRLSQISTETQNPILESLVEEVERLVTGLRDVTLSVRMMPIENVFSKFRRVVRDLSAELGKDVILQTKGGETEIDKNVIDRLSEPLVHMIRNSIDHGIEQAGVRQAAGKPAQGIVRLSARQEAGEILIMVEDDGGGLNTDAIHRKAVERGMLSDTAKPSQHELQQLIFAPGFSTAVTVSSVSGRGVGMDAVRTAIAALRGSIDVRSRPGRGTRVTLRLPLTLAIIDGLLVRLGTSTYVIPLAAVDECVEFESSERGRESGRTMLQIREQLVPFVDMAEVFECPPSTELRRRVVIVKAEGQKLGLVVDDILGQNQTVIKSLSPYHRQVDGLAGATILGDGSVALIVDVAKLARHCVGNHGAQRRSAA